MMNFLRARCGSATWNLIGVEAHEFEALARDRVIGMPVCFNLSDPGQVWPLPDEGVQIEVKE